MTQPRSFEALTESERACLRLALMRSGSKEIAPLVGLSHHMVDKRFKSAMRKLGAATRFEAARLLAEHEVCRQNTAQGQPSDSGGQSLDLPNPANLDILRASPFEHRFEEGGHFEVREHQLGFQDLAAHISSFRLPVRRLGEVRNGLSAWHRVGWIVGLALLIVVAFGFFATGLTSLGRIATHVAHTTRDK